MHDLIPLLKTGLALAGVPVWHGWLGIILRTRRLTVRFPVGVGGRGGEWSMQEEA